MKIQTDQVDWNKSDAEIARQFNCVPSAVCKRRHQLGIKPAKNYPRRKIKQLRVEAKLSERKTVHEWLNLKGVPSEEFGKPICLLRRLAIALQIQQPANNAYIPLKVGTRATIDKEELRLFRWCTWGEPSPGDNMNRGMPPNRGMLLYFVESDRQ